MIDSESESSFESLSYRVFNKYSQKLSNRDCDDKITVIAVYTSRDHSHPCVPHKVYTILGDNAIAYARHYLFSVFWNTGTGSRGAFPLAESLAGKTSVVGTR